MVVQLAGRLSMAAHVLNVLRAISDDPNERAQVAAGAALGAMLAFDADMHEKAFSTIIGTNLDLSRSIQFYMIIVDKACDAAERRARVIALQSLARFDSAMRYYNAHENECKQLLQANVADSTVSPLY